MGLKTKPHKKCYPLGWEWKYKRLQVTNKCDLKFAIIFEFIDEVEFDVVPLDIYGIVLGRLYLYDWKEMFYRKHNQFICLRKELSI